MTAFVIVQAVERSASQIMPTGQSSATCSEFSVKARADDDRAAGFVRRSFGDCQRSGGSGYPGADAPRLVSILTARLS
jgi:hypothetical protein